MRIRNLALAACLLCVGTGLAQEHHYTVREGDTLSTIANKLGVSEKQLSHANNLGNRHHLRAGRKLVVPGGRRKSHEGSVSSASGYKVRPGDNDETIAKKFHVSTRQIHRLNPDIRWSALRIGSKIRVPGQENAAVEKSGKKSVASRTKSSASSYVVRAGDNDQKIARKAGVSLKALRKANPGVHWNALQIGRHLSLPGGSAVALKGESSEAKSIHSRVAKISTDNVNVRRSPRKGAGLVTTVDEGTRVTILEHDGSWYKVRFPKGTKGWVKGEYLHSARQAVVASRRSRKHGSHLQNRIVASLERGPVVGGEELISRARSMRGVPYGYGSSSRHATDCSGYALQVYGSAGYKLPRTSHEQSGVGQAVHKSELKPGDLVFFHTGRSSRINHVGIYEGNGNFIHASSGAGHVTESSLNEGYYRKRFAVGRRVLHTKGASKKVAKPIKHVDPKHSLGPDDE